MKTLAFAGFFRGQERDPPVMYHNLNLQEFRISVISGINNHFYPRKKIVHGAQSVNHAVVYEIVRFQHYGELCTSLLVTITGASPEFIASVMFQKRILEAGQDFEDSQHFRYKFSQDTDLFIDSLNRAFVKVPDLCGIADGEYKREGFSRFKGYCDMIFPKPDISKKSEYLPQSDASKTLKTRRNRNLDVEPVQQKEGRQHIS